MTRRSYAEGSPPLAQAASAIKPTARPYGPAPRQDLAEQPQPERQAAFRLGLSAESRAAALLVAKGYRIVARRWRSPLGEVDIVARRRRSLVVIEVKARERLDDAAWSIGLRQRQRIIGAAEAWLAAHPNDAACDIRFDVMLVAPRRIPQHIANAFDASV
jgi:putative endonuclease